MSWNVSWRFGPGWSAREVGIREVVRRVQPDAPGLQETCASADDTQAGPRRPAWVGTADHVATMSDLDGCAR